MSSQSSIKTYIKQENLFRDEGMLSKSQQEFSKMILSKYRLEKEHDHSYEIADGDCSAETNCILPYGVCLTKSECLCLPDYSNVYIKGKSLKEIKCSYKKKKMIIAALLELFLPLSLGHFYVLEVRLGLIKLGYNLFVYSLCCILFIKSDDVKKSSLIICLILSCLIPIWNVVDMFLFFTGYYKDGYGVSLN